MTAAWAIDTRPDRTQLDQRGIEPDHRSRRPRLGWLRGFVAAKTAATSVEFALAAPILLTLLMPVADLGLAYSLQIQVQQAAQAGAQYASLHPWNSTSVASIANAVTAATRLDGLLAYPPPSQICGCPNGTAVVAAACRSLCANGEDAGYYVVVNAQLAYSPVLPYSLLGNSVTLMAQATVRAQ